MPVVHQLQKKMGDELLFVFRHLPLSNIHEYAAGAAEAAEAAGAQDKLWQMHDALFENQDSLDPESLVYYADQIGFDVSAFERDLEEAPVCGAGEGRFYERGQKRREWHPHILFQWRSA